MLKLDYIRETCFATVIASLMLILATRFDVTSPIASLKGSDNIISFYTERYGDNALIVQGAG